MPSGINSWFGALTTMYWIDPKNQLIGTLISQYFIEGNFYESFFSQFLIMEFLTLF